MPSKRSKKNKASRKLSQHGFPDPSTLINISKEDGQHACPEPSSTHQQRVRANHVLIPSVATEAASIAGLVSASTATEVSTNGDAQANAMVQVDEQANVMVQVDEQANVMVQVDERIQQYRMKQVKKEREYTLMISEIKIEIFQLKDANEKQQMEFHAALNEEREKFCLLDLEMCKSEKDLKKVEMQVDKLMEENECFKSSIISLKDKLKRKKAENKSLREENAINISKMKVLEMKAENSSVEANAIAAEAEEQLQQNNILIEHLQKQNVLLKEEAINAVVKNFADGIIASAEQANKAEIDFNRKLRDSELAHIKSMDDLKESHKSVYKEMNERIEEASMMNERIEAEKVTDKKKLEELTSSFEGYVNSKMDTRCFFKRKLKTEKVMFFIEHLRKAMSSSMTNPLH